MISWEATVSQGWGKIARDDKLYSMASCVSVFDAYIPLRESVFSSAIPQAVPEIIRIDFTILQTGEVDLKKNQKFLFFVYFRLPWVTCTLLVKYLYYWLRPLIIHRYHHNYHQMISIGKLIFKISFVRACSVWGSRTQPTQ